MCDATSDGALEVSDATFGYRTRSLGSVWNPVLQGIRFRLDKHEHAVVLGANGTGKTTFLRGIAGLLPPIHGTVTIGGRRPRETRIAYLPQSASVFTWKRAVDDAALFLRAVGTPKKESIALAETALRSVGYDSAMDARCFRLSGGQRQKVALARCLAVARQVDLVLLDEPTNFLDKDSRAALVDLLPCLLGQIPCPVLVVTHDQDLPPRLSGRRFTIRNGGIAQENENTQR